MSLPRYMLKRIKKRLIPHHHVLREHKHLRWCKGWLHDPNIWHFNRRSVAGAFSVGLFAAFIPIPFQMMLAAALAIPCRVNLPVSVGLVWLTNPVTMPPIFYGAYQLGAWILQVPALQVTTEWTWQAVASDLGVMWQPVLLGCFIFALASAALGNIAVRLFWRLHLIQYIRRRQRRKSLRTPHE